MTEMALLADLLRRALGAGPRVGTPQLIGERAATVLDGGVVVRDYDVCLGDGSSCCVSVASPAVQKFPCPVIAAHQTNTSGRLEVLGLADDPAFSYGLLLAQRGHKVYCMDLRWTAERQQGRPWDFLGFRDKHPAWSPLGADYQDFEDLIFLMRDVFGEHAPYNWIGHSHGAVDGLVLAASQPDGVFASMVCNAGFAGFPDRAAVERQTNLERYFNEQASIDALLAFDGIIALACEKARVRLNCYLDDEVLLYPLPTPIQVDRLSRIGPNLELAVYDGRHAFPSYAQFNAALFLERSRGFDQTVSSPYLPWLASNRGGVEVKANAQRNTAQRLQFQTFGGIGINTTEHGCALLLALVEAGLPPDFVLVSAETDAQLALSSPYFDRQDWLTAVLKIELPSVSGPKTLAGVAYAAGIPTLFVPGLSSDVAVRLARAARVDAVFLLETPVLRGEILTSAPAGLINFHAAPLPCFRGSNATLWALYHDEPLKVWAHFVAAGVDTGDLICSLPLPVKRSDDIRALATRACQVSGQLAVQLVRKARGDGVAITQQDTRRAQRFRGAMPDAVLNECIRRLAQGQYSFYAAD